MDHETFDTHTNIFTMGLTQRYTNCKLPHVDEKVLLETLHVKFLRLKGEGTMSTIEN